MRSLSLVGRAVAHLLEMRGRLFVAELQLERMRLIRCLVLAILGATLLGAAVLTAIALVVFTVAVENRTMVLGVSTALLFGSAAICIGIVLNYVYGDLPFKASTDALKEDGECLISQLKK